MKFSNRLFLLGLLVLGFLGACGGGGSSTPASPSTLSGKAAVGYPIVSGAVKVACTGGSPLNTTTDTAGAWTVTLSGQTLPCAVEVKNGTINGTANATSYHSVATSAGTVNVTPLTDLLVANLSGTDPTTWFSGVSGASASSLGQINAAALGTALGKVRAALPALTALATLDPITASFTAASGNTVDDMLSALRTALTSSGVSYSSLLSGATSSTITTPAGLSAALTTAYASISNGTGTTGSSGGTTTGGGGTTSASALPTLDNTKCATPIPGAGFGSCAAGAVADWSATLTNTFAKTSCTITVASGTFTLSNGTSTVVVHMTGDIADTVSYFNGALVGISAADNIANQLSQVTVSFSAGKLATAAATGAQGVFSCLNI